jgi:hypothetical protein
VGAWRADAQGKPTGEFVPNPDYRSRTTGAQADTLPDKP